MKISSNKKRVVSLLLVIAMLVLGLAGCGGGTDTSGSEPAAPDASTPVEDTPETDGADAPDETPAATDALKIAIVTSPNGVDDGSFNEDNYDGVQAFVANHPDATVTPVQEPDIANSVPTVESIVADYDVIVTPGFQFGEITTVARNNPDKKFILVDSFPVDPDSPDEQPEEPNILAMMFKEQESGFYAGVAAALETQSGKVAVVNGIAYPSNVNYQYGFEAGVNYANAKLGASAELVELASYAGTDVTDTNVGGNYIGNFDDVAQGKVVGNALIAEGVDILFVAAGNAGNGVFTAAKENGNVRVIGCDVDQYDDGVNGDSNIILTSALKVMSINVERALEAVADGSFTGGNQLLGADTQSTGYVSEEGRHQLSDSTIEELNTLVELIGDGTIVPPDNFSGTLPEDFPGLA